VRALGLESLGEKERSGNDRNANMEANGWMRMTGGFCIVCWFPELVGNASLHS
jgi:hypothetical protein